MPSLSSLRILILKVDTLFFSPAHSPSLTSLPQNLYNSSLIPHSSLHHNFLSPSSKTWNPIIFYFLNLKPAAFVEVRVVERVPEGLVWGNEENGPSSKPGGSERTEIPRPNQRLRSFLRDLRTLQNVVISIFSFLSELLCYRRIFYLINIKHNLRPSCSSISNQDGASDENEMMMLMTMMKMMMSVVLPMTM